MKLVSFPKLRTHPKPKKLRRSVVPPGGPQPPFLGGDIGVADDSPTFKRIVFGVEAQFMTPGGPLSGTWDCPGPPNMRITGIYYRVSFVQSDTDSILFNFLVDGVGIFGDACKGSPPAAGKNSFGDPICSFDNLFIAVPLNIPYTTGLFQLFVGTDNNATIKDWELQGFIQLGL